jgi:hypothetical protein
MRETDVTSNLFLTERVRTANHMSGVGPKAEASGARSKCCDWPLADVPLVRENGCFGVGEHYAAAVECPLSGVRWKLRRVVAASAYNPQQKSRPQANSFSSLNTPNDHRIHVVRGPTWHINYRGSF